jgi:hypothetical protein
MKVMVENRSDRLFYAPRRCPRFFAISFEPITEWASRFCFALNCDRLPKLGGFVHAYL